MSVYLGPYEFDDTTIPGQVVAEGTAREGEGAISKDNGKTFTPDPTKPLPQGDMKEVADAYAKASGAVVSTTTRAVMAANMPETSQEMDEILDPKDPKKLN